MEDRFAERVRSDSTSVGTQSHLNTEDLDIIDKFLLPPVLCHRGLLAEDEFVAVHDDQFAPYDVPVHDDEHSEQLTKNENPVRVPVCLSDSQDSTSGGDPDQIAPYDVPVLKRRTATQPVFQVSTDSDHKNKVEEVLAPLPTPMATTKGGVFIPDSKPFEGGWGFKVTFDKSDSRKALYQFDEESSTVFVKPNINFVAMFNFDEELAATLSQYRIRALVCLKKPQDVLQRGVVVVPQIGDSYGSEAHHRDHFLLSNNPETVYSKYNNHRVVTVPLNSMPATVDGCPSCVYKCAKYTTDIVGKGANKPTMIIIFSLLKDGMEVARDVVNVRCMSSLNRDTPKILKREAEAVAGLGVSKRRRLNSRSVEITSPTPQPTPPSPVVTTPTLPHPFMANIPPTCKFDFVKEEQPDEDGYYTRTIHVKTKDRSKYNLMKMLEYALSSSL